jgi:hypothetical protein
MAATPVYALPYPGTGESPHGPNQLAALALALEAKLVLLDAAIAAKEDPALFIRKPGNEPVTSSTALQDDNDFAFAVAANAVYVLDDALLLYSGAATGAGDLKMQFTGPAGSTFVWTNFGANIGGSTQYNVVTETLAAGAPRSVPTNFTTQMSCSPKGTLVTAGTSGILQFRWAQNTSSATATVVAINSWMRLRRVA